MLFDPRGKRRRVIQVTYVSMAVLFALSLVGFGIGSGTHGGLFDALTRGSAEGHGGSQEQEQLVQRYEDLTKANPKSERAWLGLARAEANVALAGGNFDRETRQPSDRGRQVLGRAARAWERYLALNPRHPDAGVAAVVVQAYVASSDAGGAIRAQRIVNRSRPSARGAYQLALLAYAGGRRELAGEAGKQAIRLTPTDQRPNVRSLLRQARAAGERPTGLQPTAASSDGHGAQR